MGPRQTTLDVSQRRSVAPSTSPPSRSRTARPVEAIVFELGGVLYDDTGWQRWLLMLLSRMGLHTQYESFYRVWRRDHRVEVDCGRCNYWEALRGFLRAAGMTSAQIDEVEAAGRARREQFEEYVRPFPGVPAVIANLRNRGVRLAVLSNSGCDSEHLRRRLARLGMAQQFEIVISSRDLGCAKPAHDCYRAIHDALRLRAAQTAMVSHDARDLAGAGAFGMQTFAIHHDADALADCFLERFDQLLTETCRPGSRSLAS